MLTTRATRRATPSGVTLIELLITITIVSILSAAFLGTSQLAMESSREARTKSTVGKIHSLLMEKWNEYSTRRVDVHPAIVNATIFNIDNNSTYPTLPEKRRIRGLALADLRLLATRELMKLEMPDRWSDIAINEIPASNPTEVAFGYQSVLGAIPAVTEAYRRRLRSLSSPDGPVSRETILENQGAECLYMIIMLTTADGEARTLFSEQDIGDTDGDGALEFLDGWQRPIDFVRWPAGFHERSDLMAGPRRPDPNNGILSSADHDPTDMFRRDEIDINEPVASVYPTAVPNPTVPLLGSPTVARMMSRIRSRNHGRGLSISVGAFRLVPLVFSRGPDGEGDIDTSVLGLQYTRSSADPYAFDPSEQIFDLGRPYDVNQDGDDNSLDNIHNHLQDNR